MEHAIELTPKQLMTLDQILTASTNDHEPMKFTIRLDDDQFKALYFKLVFDTKPENVEEAKDLAELQAPFIKEQKGDMNDEEAGMMGIVASMSALLGAFDGDEDTSEDD